MLFRDRRAAGRVLAAKLEHYAGQPDVLVLALPRGGVPVAFEVSKQLRAPLDIFLVRKLGVPQHEELAMGATATGGVRFLNTELIRRLGISEAAIEAVDQRERNELTRRERAYRGDRPPPMVAGKTVILVDDGLATGATMRAALMALRQQKPGRVVAAVPVGAAEACAEFQHEADETICAVTPEPFHGVGFWYADFSQTSDEEVVDLLERARRELGTAGPRPGASGGGRRNQS